jgi:glycosyltransferase involved in cell wall biosynthesis
VGRFVKQKGIKHLFDAFKKVSAKKDVNLLIIGKGPEFEEFKAASKKMKVKMIYNAPEEKLPSYFACADVCVVPSLWEPFGLVAVEAMACSLPVITSNVGGLREIVEKDCGILVKAADSGAIADELVELLKNEDKMKKMGLNGRKMVEKYFSWETVTKNLYNFYEKL